jgi:hypothetical protein
VADIVENSDRRDRLEISWNRFVLKRRKACSQGKPIQEEPISGIEFRLRRRFACPRAVAATFLNGIGA